MQLVQISDPSFYFPRVLDPIFETGDSYPIGTKRNINGDDREATYAKQYLFAIGGFQKVIG